MILSVQQIKFEIYAYIKEFGADFREWYIGISDDPKAAMRNYHGIEETEDIWLYKQAVSYRACQTIHRYFTEQLKVQGEQPTSADEGTNCIYLYKKSARTRP